MFPEQPETTQPATETRAVCPEKLKRAEALVYEYQRARLEVTYRDTGGLDDVRDLFFRNIYPPPERRGEFEGRNRAFVRSARNPLLRLVVSKPVITILREVIELNEMTARINLDMAREIAAMEPMPGRLDDALFFPISRRVSTLDQRRRQLKCALDGFKICAGVVLYFPMNLEQIIRLVPRPLIRNNQLLELAVSTYGCFSNHRSRLLEYHDMMMERETAYIDRMFDVGAEGGGDE